MIIFLTQQAMIIHMLDRQSARLRDVFSWRCLSNAVSPAIYWYKHVIHCFVLKTYMYKELYLYMNVNVY